MVKTTPLPSPRSWLASTLHTANYAKYAIVSDAQMVVILHVFDACEEIELKGLPVVQLMSLYSIISLDGTPPLGAGLSLGGSGLWQPDVLMRAQIYTSQSPPRSL